MSKEIEAEFDAAMRNTCIETRRLGYNPTYFLGMINEHGGVRAAKRLLGTPATQTGLTQLWELRRLDISAEALVLNEKWRDLFSDDERQRARERLLDHGYDPG